MADIDHEISIKASVETIYKALTTLDGLRAWHTVEVEGDAKVNGHLIFKAEGKPTFDWKILSLDPHNITWECVSGPGDSAGTKVIYKISKYDDERSLVEMRHAGWPGQHGNFRKCNTLWGILLHHLKTYAETKSALPAIK
ncbi:MAG: SRPBCC domain-containing protein [Parachlamydiales bacterium]|jgi:uncharacterized protein YndB with AHSA1/START domain